MTTEQAAQLIQQQQELLESYELIRPLVANIVRDIFPALAVSFAWLIGAGAAWAAT